jgi:hypothetical protein
MVRNSHEGIFYGTPRKWMERVGGSSGPLYTTLKDEGIVNTGGRGDKGKWRIPQSLIEKFKKRNGN